MWAAMDLYHDEGILRIYHMCEATGGEPLS
jgi:hypothetical protein